MKNNKKLNTFYINARLGLDLTIEIKAADLDAAVEVSKTLKEEDFVTILGDWNEGNIKITGIFEEYKNIEI